MDEKDFVLATKEEYKELKRLYQKATDEKQEMFIWKEREVLTAYAKYLIQYMDSKLGKK
jgi:hypothetical protein